MKRLITATLCSVIVAATPVATAEHKRNHGPSEAGVSKISVQVWFPPKDVTVIREYYEPHHRALPPGLAKKYRRTGKLPPGWQKKFHPLPGNVERQLIVLPAEYQRGVLDGHAVIFNRRTQVIVDLAVLF